MKLVGILPESKCHGGISPDYEDPKTGLVTVELKFPSRQLFPHGGELKTSNPKHGHLG
jgi:hypothetical protein